MISNSKIQAVNLIRLFKRKGIKVIDLEPENIAETMEMATGVITAVDAFITTTDTLMQSGAEQALVDLSKKHQIPILSSNKNGIEQGATFGPVADFFVLGKMSGDMAGKILTQSEQPHTLSSQHQDPPTFLFNKDSLTALGMSLPKGLSGHAYVD